MADVRCIGGLAIVVLTSSTAIAQIASATTPRPATEPVAPPAEPVPPVAPAPLPGEESGRIDAGDGGDSLARVIARGILFVPKLALNVAFAPVRASVWAFDRYQLPDLYQRIFFNEAVTMGLYPTVGFESFFGLTAGARFVHRDLFGEREHLAVQASFGGQFRQAAALELRTGHRFEPLAFELDAGIERRPHDAFYGIGNGDDVAGAPAPIDPRVDPTAVEARYRQQRMRVALVADARVWESLHVRPAGALTDLDFGPGDTGAPIDMVYDPTALVGFGGVQLAYGEVEVRWDSRRRVDETESNAIHAAGSLAAAFGGRAHRLDAGRDYWRYGVDLQHFIKFAQGPRIIAARLHGEGVSGSREDVPFTELPKLGGLLFLRGYPLDRFRDRVAAFGSLEYQWDLSLPFSASLFVDAGRVAPSVRDLAFDHLRVGYGVGVEYHTTASFVFRASVASSIDGGLMLNLALNPVFDLDQRVRRR